MFPFVWNIDFKYINMLFISISIKSCYRNSRCKNQNWYYQNDDKEIVLVIADINLVVKEFQKHKYYHKNITRVPSKSNYSTSNASMEDFTPGLNSAINIIEQGVIPERCYSFLKIFFICYFAAPRPTLGHCRRGNFN